MPMISILIALLLHLLCVMVKGQPSTCSEYFTYMTKPGVTDMLGQIEIPPPSVNDAFYLKVALNTATELPSKVVRLELAQSVQESVLAVSFGRSLLYHVYYPSLEPIPSLSAIWFNNHRYCPGPQANGNITATIELGHILYPPNEENLVDNFGPWQQISQPWHRNFSSYRIDNPSYERLNNDKCGITSYYTDETNRLISDGETMLPGQWPWLVAIYVQNNENEYIFACAGSLLTTRHVITANFFIKWNRIHSTDFFPELHRLYVSFGQFNSREWPGNHAGIVTRAVADFKEKADLVILILKTAIEYNAFIRPVCLYSGSTNLQDIVNMTGYIVGWGFNVIRNSCYTLFNICLYKDTSHKVYAYTEEPRTVKVPLISISEYSVGDRKTLIVPISSWNVNPCDNGSGFVVSNIHTGHYELRGVAVQCFPTSFNSYYTDIVNHMSWIRHQISNM